MADVTIIMYHYVRDLKHSRYPEIKGLETVDFKQQLGYLKKNYTFLTMEECLEQIENPRQNFPDNGVLLTFDDGYLEHYLEVFPLLDEMGIQGSFFPPVQAIMERKVLDVNKIHYLLATAPDTEQLVSDTNDLINDLAGEYHLHSPDVYAGRIGPSEHRFDPPEIIYLKRLLQRELPEVPRKHILNELFKTHVEVDEAVLAQELYLNQEQLRCIQRNGMFIGGHGYSHNWLNAMEREAQKDEIDQTSEFLDALEVPPARRVMCYPYGAYDDSLIDILKEQGYRAGIATTPGKASLTPDNRFALQRLDTNDIPLG